MIFKLSYFWGRLHNKKTSDVALNILDMLKLYDDISLFNVCKMITDWNIPITTEGDEFIKKAIGKIKSFSIQRKQIFDFYCLLWIKTKYDPPEKLYNFIFEYEGIWKTHPFLRRQVTSIMSRLFLYKEEKVQKFLESQISTAEQQVVSIANNLINLKRIDKTEGKVKFYLFPQKKPKIYPLQKFLVLCSFLNSGIYRNDIDVKKKIRSYIDDCYYRKWLEVQYNIKTS